MAGGILVNGREEGGTVVIIPTLLQMSTDLMEYWTRLTCLYDRYWTADPDKVTLPICMFHVKKITPTRQVETSKKRVILYEAKDTTATAMADTARLPVMQTIIDNSVRQPVTYNMEIIVPFQPIGRYITDGIKFLTDIMTSFTNMFGSDEKVMNFMNGVQSAISTIFTSYYN